MNNGTLQEYFTPVRRRVDVPPIAAGPHNGARVEDERAIIKRIMDPNLMLYTILDVFYLDLHAATIAVLVESNTPGGSSKIHAAHSLIHRLQVLRR